MNKISISKIIKFLTIVAYGILSITDGLYVSKNIQSMWISFKYIPVIVIILLFGIYKFDKNNIKNNIFNGEFKKLIFIISSILVISIIMQIINSDYTINTYIILFKVVLGILFTYSIINTFKINDIYDIMKWMLFFSIIGYVLQVGINNFTLGNIKKMNFFESYSPLESHYFSGPFLASASFFSYYRKKKIYLIISVIFTILTFKRLAIIFAIFLLVLPYFINIDKKIKKKYVYVLPIIFVFLTLGYHELLQPENKEIFYKVFHDTPSHYTMGRSSRLNVVENNNFKSYGLGSAGSELGLEMLEIDFIEIYIELTIIGLIIFIFGFWSICNGQLYCIIFMCFLSLNFLTAGTFSSSFIWNRNLLIISSVLYFNDSEFIGNRPNFINKIKIKKT